MRCNFFLLSDRYSAIWIDPSGPTIAESIGCCLLSGHGQACPQTHHFSQASHTKHKLAGRLKLKQDDACIWKPAPLDENPTIVYLEIYRVFLEINESLISRNRIYTSMSETYDTQVGHSL
jgi:hypothetical protein